MLDTIRHAVRRGPGLAGLLGSTDGRTDRLTAPIASPLPQMANLKATLSKTLDMPPTKTASHDVDAALVPIEKELQQALAALQRFAAEKDKPVHATDLRAARETLGHVDSLYHEGAIVIPGVEGVPAGQVRGLPGLVWWGRGVGGALTFRFTDALPTH